VRGVTNVPDDHTSMVEAPVAASMGLVFVLVRDLDVIRHRPEREWPFRQPPWIPPGRPEVVLRRQRRTVRVDQIVLGEARVRRDVLVDDSTIGGRVSRRRSRPYR
jgi:hypothetical protein